MHHFETSYPTPGARGYIVEVHHSNLEPCPDPQSEKMHTMVPLISP
uniref:Uncharacterized protein n=1 Tax=Arundo donax TaxID=35708 RepID=A0A0A8Y212_ARUDO